MRKKAPIRAADKKIGKTDIYHTRCLHKKCVRFLRDKCWWEHETQSYVLYYWSDIVCKKCAEYVRKPMSKSEVKKDMDRYLKLIDGMERRQYNIIEFANMLSRR